MAPKVVRVTFSPRMDTGPATGLLGEAAVSVGRAAGNINTGGPRGELMQLSATGRRLQDQHADALEAVSGYSLEHSCVLGGMSVWACG